LENFTVLTYYFLLTQTLFKSRGNVDVFVRNVGGACTALKLLAKGFGFRLFA